MVSGGSGITPFVSISRELIYLRTTMRYRTPKVILICAFKDSSCLSMLDLILPSSGTHSDNSNIQLQIEAYITREKKLKSNSPIHVQSIRFNPNSRDAPVVAMIGPNSWGWLDAIISCSFIIFLILIWIITRYYIYIL